jgi:hypothetical protein
VGEDSDAISWAALAVILVGLLSGIGNGLYAYNADLLNKGDAGSYRILFEGQIFLNTPVVTSAVSIIGITVAKWLMLSLAIYWFGSKIVGIPSSYDRIARLVAFAFVPEALMIFLPLFFSNPPTLMFGWPVGLYLITRLWLFVMLLYIVAHAFDFTRMRALGVTIFGLTVYWIVYNVFIVPTLNVPGVRIEFAMPESSAAILATLGVVTVASTLLGLFSRRQSV